jgi:hypothetical protein
MMTKMRFSGRLRNNEITTHRYRALTFAKYTTIMIAELTIISGLGSSLE